MKPEQSKRLGPTAPQLYLLPSCFLAVFKTSEYCLSLSALSAEAELLVPATKNNEAAAVVKINLKDFLISFVDKISHSPLLLSDYIVSISSDKLAVI